MVKPSEPQETSERDSLGAAKGILIGLLIGLLFWGLLVATLKPCVKVIVTVAGVWLLVMAVTL